MKLLVNRSVSVILLLIFTTACNVSPQQPMKTTGAVLDTQILRVTPQGTSVGMTNFILTNGPRPDVSATWTFTANNNTALVLDAPIIFANECEVKNIKYKMSWTLLDETAKDFETTDLGDDVTKKPFTSEKGANYLLRVRVYNMDLCQRISFKFNVFETPGYLPLSKPLVTSSAQGENLNTVQPRIGFVPEITHDFSMTSDKVSYFKINKTSFTASPCDPNQAKFEFTWMTWDSKNAGPSKSTPVTLNDTFGTDSGIRNVLRVRVSNIKECKNSVFAFAAVPAPAPSPSPSPNPATETPQPATP